MRPCGRTSRAAFTLHAILLYLLACVSNTSSNTGVPIEIKLWDSGRSPLSHMVDVTNEFGLKVLAEHNFLNDNNIAFSPYGLVGILVALFEGVDGESSYQIQQGMQLPWNRNVMRIGFRDIHRTLKTYFVPEEGFLAGLALSNENVIFNDGYKTILRFYGFDLDNEQLPTSTPAPSNVTTVILTSTTTSVGTTIAISTEAMPSREDTTTTRNQSTTNANAETIGEVDIREPSTTITEGTSSVPNAENTQTSTDDGKTEMRSADTTLQTTPMTTADNQSIRTTSIITTGMTPSPTVGVETTPETTPMPMTNEPTATNEQETVSTSMVTSSMNARSTATESMTMTTETATDLNAMSETLQTEPTSTTTEATTGTDSTTIEATMSTDSVTESTIETLQRRKKSIVDFIYTNPPYLDDYLYFRSFDIGSEFADHTRGDDMFLVNGLRSEQVTYMHYDSVLEHAYLPHLEAAALRLPLDSDRYYLLVVLPSRGGATELGRLLGRMARESDLADVYAALRPRRVRAVVPSFIVKGHITLTTDLQKLGIRDVFEPRQRDFTPMTHQSGVYVRSIEQAVSVAIRKYQPDNLKKNRYVVNQQPVRFSATYPFLYFVMDANIHVALMAGKMVDPLNTRIL